MESMGEYRLVDDECDCRREASSCERRLVSDEGECRSESEAIGPVAQWIRHRPTELGIAGSSPAGVIVWVSLLRNGADNAHL